MFLKQFSEVCIFSACRFEVEDLILDANPQVVQRLLQSVDTPLEFPVTVPGLPCQLGQSASRFLRGAIVAPSPSTRREYVGGERLLRLPSRDPVEERVYSRVSLEYPP